MSVQHAHDLTTVAVPSILWRICSIVSNCSMTIALNIPCCPGHVNQMSDGRYFGSSCAYVVERSETR
jgi:hypothetical protein